MAQSAPAGRLPRRQRRWAATIGGLSIGRTRLAPTLFGIATIALFLALWQFCVEAGWWNKLIAPAPSDIAAAFGQLFDDEGLVRGFFQTLGETTAAALLAIAVGVPVGLWLHRSRWAGRAYYNWFASMAAAP